MQIGEVRDPYPFEVLEEAFGTCEPSNPKPARRVMPRVPLTQKPLSKLPQTIDGGGSAHI
jgi:hypothetical protein